MRVYPNVSDRVEVPRGTPNGTLFVSVDETYQNPRLPGVSLEDCARGYWTERNLAASHAEECDYLMARKHGRIVGAWRIDQKAGWLDPAQSPKRTWPQDRPLPSPPRKGCQVIEDEPRLGLFIGQPVRLGRCPCTLRGYFDD